MNDTVILGLAFDLTATDSFQYKTVSGEDAEAPPPPILYAYASDGTVVGWHVVNTNNLPYPGMTTTSTLPVSQTSSMDAMKPSSETAGTSQPPASVFSPPSVFGQTASTTSAFGFGQPSAPAFGQSGFGQSSFSTSTPAFGQSSFGGAAAPKSGFGAFATGGPVAWGQGTSAFGSNALAPSTSVQSMASPMAVSNSTSAEEAMAADGMADTSLGGLSLGGAGESMDVIRPTTGRGAGGLFGSLPAAEPPKASEEVKPATGFGAFGAIKPATGFGAFGSGSGGAFGSGTSAFGSGTSAFSGGSGFTSGSSTTPSTSADAAKPSSGFGATGFGTAGTTSAFGQSSFGKSSFGQSSFGTSSFGSSATPSPAPTSAFSSTGSGFGAFAQGGTTGFGAPTKDAGANGKPVWATGSDKEEGDEKKSVFGGASGGGFSAFAQGGTTAFGVSKQEPAATGPSTSQSGTEEKKSESVGSPSEPPFTARVFGVTLSKPQSDSSDVKVKAEEQYAKASSPFGGAGFGSTIPAKSPTTLDRTQERSTTPPSPSSDALASTPPSPAATPAKVKKESSTTPPASPFANSPFKSAASGPTSGAFASLTANSHGFSKLDSGFGAFGGGVSTSSPFFKPPQVSGTSPFGGASTTPTTTPKSVFGAQSTPVSAFGKPGTATPTSAFGAQSPLGASGSAFGKPSWGTTPTTTTTPAPTPSTTTSAFSAFSGTSSGLSAFSSGSGSGKTFSDLLREAKDSPESVKVSKAPVASGESYLQYTQVLNLKLVTIATDDENEDEGHEATELTFDDDQVEGDEDDTGSFLSQSFSEESVPEEEGVEEEAEEEDEDEDEAAEDHSESPDQTPKPELPSEDEEESKPAEASTPSIQLTSPSPPATPAATEGSKGKAPATDASTTPPGSPVKQPSPPPPATPPVAAPVPVTPASVPFGVGIGRPSTRPTRSSPLASAPISGNDEERVEPVPTSKSAPPLVDTMATPKAPATEKPIAQMPSPTPSSGDDQSPLMSKSKAPPLFSTTPPIPKPGIFSVPPSGFGQTAAPQAGPSTATPPSVPAATSSIFTTGPGGFGPTKGPSPAPTFTPLTNATTPAKTSIFPGGFSGFGSKTASPSPSPAPAPAFTPSPVKVRTNTSPAGPIPPANIFKLPTAPTPAGVFSNTTSPPVFPAPPKPAITPGTPTMPSPSGSLSFGQKAGPSVPPIQIPGAVPQNAEPQETLEGMQRACLGMYNLAEQELRSVR